MSVRGKKILGAAIGECVHVAGISNFLALAEQGGFETVFLGPAVSIEQLIKMIKRIQPDIVALGYRLSDDACLRILNDLKEKLSKEGLLDKEYIFGGTIPTAHIAKKTDLFTRVFDGTQSLQEIKSYFSGISNNNEKIDRSFDNLVDRINEKQPYPLIRHHIGLPTVEQTLKDIERIAESGELDIISIAPDQTAQKFFFKHEKQKQESTGAGGVPIRSQEDLIRIYSASRRGNYPLVRCYSGTDDILKWAKMLVKTIHNAWAAIPLFWYNRMDGRGPRSLLQGIQEAQEAIRWHAQRNIPLEINDSHQWSLRYAPDALAVAVAYLAAYNAKKLGIKHYVSQYMLQTPPQISPKGDLAKMMAKIELIEGLHGDDFHSYRMVRPGLMSFPTDLEYARGQLAFGATIGLVLRPHIFHVVAYCEAQYCTGATEILESVKMVNQMIRCFQCGFPIDSILSNQFINDRKNMLKQEALSIIEAIRFLGKGIDDPLVEPDILLRAVEIGILDAPNLRGCKPAKGEIITTPINGNYVSVNPENGRPMTETERVQSILKCYV